MRGAVEPIACRPLEQKMLNIHEKPGQSPARWEGRGEGNPPPLEQKKRNIREKSGQSPARRERRGEGNPPPLEQKMPNIREKSGQYPVRRERRGEFFSAPGAQNCRICVKIQVGSPRDGQDTGSGHPSMRSRAGFLLVFFCVFRVFPPWPKQGLDEWAWRLFWTTHFININKPNDQKVFSKGFDLHHA